LLFGFATIRTTNGVIGKSFIRVIALGLHIKSELVTTIFAYELAVSKPVGIGLSGSGSTGTGTLAIRCTAILFTALSTFRTLSFSGFGGGLAFGFVVATLFGGFLLLCGWFGCGCRGGSGFCGRLRFGCLIGIIVLLVTLSFL
jgi:hypothetical protein